MPACPAGTPTTSTTALQIVHEDFLTSNEMEAYTSNLGQFTDSLTDSMICLHYALVSHLKLVPVLRACLLYTSRSSRLLLGEHIPVHIRTPYSVDPGQPPPPPPS